MSDASDWEIVRTPSDTNRLLPVPPARVVARMPLGAALSFCAILTDAKDPDWDYVARPSGGVERRQFDLASWTAFVPAPEPADVTYANVDASGPWSQAIGWRGALAIGGVESGPPVDPPRPTAIHPTAFVDPAATLGEGCTIGPMVWIGPHVIIGARCKIGPGAMIGQNGFGYSRTQAGHWRLKPHRKGVFIGADVHVGANACIDRGSWRDTWIGQGARIDNLVHVAHNAVIGEDAVLVAHAMIAGSATIGAGAWVGPGACVMQRTVVGRKALVGMGAIVTKNVPADVTVAGCPARVIDAERGVREEM